jgi:surface protein
MRFIFGTNTVFNQDISMWNTSNVTDFGLAFSHASAFQQDISLWDYSSAIDMDGFLFNTSLSTNLYSNLLMNFANNPNIQNGIIFDGGNAQYDITAVSSRDYLVNTKSWTITDGGAA